MCRFLATLVALMPFVTLAVHADEPIALGSRRELMVDDFLVEKMKGLRFELHRPTPREVVLVHDAPWEGSGCGYHSIFQDGDRYRMYYKAWQLTIDKNRLTQPHPLFACYAESKDGIHWTKPDLGLVEFDGSKKNNIILAPGKIGGVAADPGHIAVFRDDNPDSPKSVRYKAIVRSPKPLGLLAFGSPDGIRFSPMKDELILSKGAFDSQNLAFWDAERREYRAYYRYFDKGRRDIMTATSKDFLEWSEPTPLRYPGAAKEHLYTNQVKPYHRAPHLYVGFPTRYVERGWNPSMRALPELAHREKRSKASNRYGMAVTEGLLMTSRDGVTFQRWGEAFLRPGPERPGSWNYGQQYIGWHVVETKSPLEGAGNELSLYASEGYWTGKKNQLRRYTLRIDGFVSMHADREPGEWTTKPLTFAGTHLELNFASSASGGLSIEIQDATGKPIPGYTLADCAPVFGDSLARTVTWKGGDLTKLADQPIRLRFVMKDSDLYSFRFR